MKNVYVLLFFCCLLSGCSDESQVATFDTTSTAQFANRPEANPTHDNSYKGIYKGIIAGNISASLYVNIYNVNDNQIFAKIQTENHETFMLENVTFPTGKMSEPTYKRFHFQSGKISFDLKLDEFGNNITVTNFKFFSDETSKICLKKETSTSLLKCYIGMFTNDNESGRINFTSDGELKVKGLSTDNNSPSINDVNGEITIITSETSKLSFGGNIDPNILFQLNANLHIGQIYGYLKGYKFNGNWMYDGNQIGTWNAERIL